MSPGSVRPRKQIACRTKRFNFAHGRLVTEKLSGRCRAPAGAEAEEKHDDGKRDVQPGVGGII
jgi:porphobilinogen deaminase